MKTHIHKEKRNVRVKGMEDGKQPKGAVNSEGKGRQIGDDRRRTRNRQKLNPCEKKKKKMIIFMMIAVVTFRIFRVYANCQSNPLAEDMSAGCLHDRSALFPS
jgi:hypothetical protein